MTVLFISPHADDICLSMGGVAAIAPRPAVLVTVFTQSNWVDPSWEGHAKPSDIPRIRREEDASYCAYAELDYVPLGLPDSGVRLGGRGDLRRPSGDEARLRASVEAAIADVVRSTGAEAVFAPAGLGGHADHAVCHAAARRACADLPLAFYEDLPYACELPMWRIALRARSISPRLSPVTLEHPVNFSEKAAAMRACYPSQCNPVMDDAIGIHSRRLGARLGSRHPERLVERLWVSGDPDRVLRLLTGDVLLLARRSA